MSLFSEHVVDEALGCQCHGETMVDRENSRGGRSWLRLLRKCLSTIAFKVEVTHLGQDNYIHVTVDYF